jgi:hypothetical protein
MLLLLGNLSKNQPSLNVWTAPGTSGSTQVLLSRGWKAQEPKNAIRNALQNTNPDMECGLYKKGQQSPLISEVEKGISTGQIL